MNKDKNMNNKSQTGQNAAPAAAASAKKRFKKVP